MSVAKSKETIIVEDKVKLELYKLMQKTRATEEHLLSLYRKGKIVGGLYLGLGIEATPVGSALALEKQDFLFPIHRDLGAHLAKGQSIHNILLQYLGRGNSLTKGKDSGIHASDLSLRIVGNVSHLGAMIPVAIGTAVGKRMQGEDVVALTFIGEGGSNIGDFHEGLNFAAVQKAPFVLVIENNHYAYSTPWFKQFACKRLVDRAVGYGIPGEFVDGTDAIAVYAAVRAAVNRARKGEGPTLIECESMRISGHSAHDNAFYVDKKLIEKWHKKDPILTLETKLFNESILSEKLKKKIEKDIQSELEEATQVALESPMPEPSLAAEGVFV